MRRRVVMLVVAAMLVSSTSWANWYNNRADSTIKNDQSMTPTYANDPSRIRACGPVWNLSRMFSNHILIVQYYRTCGSYVNGVFDLVSQFTHDCNRNRTCPPPSGYLLLQ